MITYGKTERIAQGFALEVERDRSGTIYIENEGGKICLSSTNAPYVALAILESHAKDDNGLSGHLWDKLEELVKLRDEDGGEEVKEAQS